MPRYIDTEQAFEVIKNLLYETAINNADINEAVDVICQDIAENRLAAWLNEVPTVEFSEGVKWIPVSERLPEESGHYIVTAKAGNSYRTTFVRYGKRAREWSLSGRMAYWHVVAWLPLPEPYMGGGENDG